MKTNYKLKILDSFVFSLLTVLFYGALLVPLFTTDCVVLFFLLLPFYSVSVLLSILCISKATICGFQVLVLISSIILAVIPTFLGICDIDYFYIIRNIGVINIVPSFISSLALAPYDVISSGEFAPNGADCSNDSSDDS